MFSGHHRSIDMPTTVRVDARVRQELRREGEAATTKRHALCSTAAAACSGWLQHECRACTAIAAATCTHRPTERSIHGLIAASRTPREWARRRHARSQDDEDLARAWRSRTGTCCGVRWGGAAAQPVVYVQSPPCYPPCHPSDPRSRTRSDACELPKGGLIRFRLRAPRFPRFATSPIVEIATSESFPARSGTGFGLSALGLV